MIDFVASGFTSKDDLYLDKTRKLLIMLNSVTADYSTYDRVFGRKLQTTLYRMIDANRLEASAHMLKDSDIVRTLLEIESNLLMGCEWLELSEQYSTWSADEDIGFVTNSIRTLLVEFEKIYGKVIMGEETEFVMDLEGFKISISKYSRLQDSLEDKEDSFTKLSYYYPLSDAQQPTDRQSFTEIAFKANPFLGSYYSKQTVISNTTVYFSYRDSFGQYLDNSYMNSTIEMNFFYKFTPLFLENITTCAHINIGEDFWSNETC